MRFSAFFALLALIPFVAPAQSAAQEGSKARVWQDEDRGWHFYEPTPPKQPRPKKREEEPKGSTPSADSTPLSSAWLRENMQRFMDRAIDNPTPENVETWMLLQRLAMDKSQRFQEVTQQVVALNPTLDERQGMGGSSAERQVARSEADDARTEVLKAMSAKIGIWYFFRSDCPYCMRQDPSLLRLTAETGIQILPISTDGPPLASGAFPQYVVDQGQAAQLGVSRTPTLVVSHPESNDLVILFEGLAMLDEIEDRLIDLGLAKGWITREQFDRATRGEESNFIDERSRSRNEDELRAMAEDPEALLKHLREAAARSAVRQQTTSTR